MFILAILAIVATSCTPESIEDASTDDQQIDKDEYHETIPPTG